ncbi:MAG: right-handed parallel beta-helix repeat-containing protein, partial [Algisphaera sp.]
LPAGAQVVFEAVRNSNGAQLTDFRHVVSGGNWAMSGDRVRQLPVGELTLTATLVTPGRRNALAKLPVVVTGDDEPDVVFVPWPRGAPVHGPKAPTVARPATAQSGEGFPAFAPPSGSRVYYVATGGNDGNDGLSKQRPLKTLRAAYNKLRDRSSDWVLLQAGDTFSGGFGGWAKSGASPASPIHVGVYGEGDRPRIRTNGDSVLRAQGNVENIRIEGIHGYANRRLDQTPTSKNIWRESGITLVGGGRNWTIQDCKLEGFHFNFIFQGYNGKKIHDINLYRNIVTRSFSHWNGNIGGHSSGIYAENVHGMEIVECTFDHNGWNPRVSGAQRTLFNHNIYIQTNSSNVNVRRSIMARGASHGLQLRPGGEVVDNLFVRNALGFFVANNPSLVQNNVVLESDDIGRLDPRGQGITINPVQSANVTGNLIANKAGNAAWMHAIYVDPNPSVAAEGGAFRVHISNNTVWNWTMESGYAAIDGNRAGSLTGSGNVIDGTDQQTGRRVVYRDTSVGFDRYVDGGLQVFIDRAVNRPRGSWEPRFSATGFNNYMRDGFTPVSGTGSF